MKIIWAYTFSAIHNDKLAGEKTMRIIADRRYRAGFSLVELLVVLGIIAILVSLLVPAVTSIRQSANCVLCSNNLRQVGGSLSLFTKDHNDRLPYAQCIGYLGQAMPWWDSTMYEHDFFELIGQYGLNVKSLSCPTCTNPELELTNGVPWEWQFNPSETAAQAMADSAALSSTYRTVAVLGPQLDPDEPTYATPGLMPNFVDFLCYAYMGPNGQMNPATPANAVPNFWVYKQFRPTKTGTLIDSNAPVMADETFYQVPNNYAYNHGSNWTITSINTSTNTVTAHLGTPLVNVLYVDNHVETKPPDLTAYAIYGGPAYCFR